MSRTITATTPGNCDCCTGGSGICSPEVRSRGGTATLCGYDTYSPLSPPKKFRRLSFTGTMSGKAYATAGCSANLLLDGSASFSGANSYDAETCALTVGGAASGDAGSVTGITSLAASGLVSAWLTYGGRSVTTASPTRRVGAYTSTAGNTGGCVTDGGFASWDVPGAVASEELSEEDTESDAMARQSDGWSEWSTSLEFGCAGIEPRTVGFSFGYAQAQYRVTVIGRGQVTLRLYFSRRLYGAGAFEPYGFLDTFMELGDAETNPPQVVTGSVPNDYGYQTCFTGCEIVTS